MDPKLFFHRFKTFPAIAPITAAALVSALRVRFDHAHSARRRRVRARQRQAAVFRVCRADQQERESQAKQAFDRLGTELQQQQQQQFAEHAARSDAEFSKAHPEYSDPVKREEMETRTLN